VVVIAKRSAHESRSSLPAAEFQILVALLDRPRHGHGIRKHVAERTGGAVEIGPGTLYMAIKRMLERGDIAETDAPPDSEGNDERRRYYRITEAGRAATQEEATRLRRLLDLARDKELLPGTDSS
jgi:DNA-binding PadR family transcriptional regulator